jgi:hypothetical protein
VGSISSVAALTNDEKTVQIHPEEIFHGSPPPSVTALTSQGACLPKLTLGSRWLFYLREVNGKPIVLDYFGNDSLPSPKQKNRSRLFVAWKPSEIAAS